MAKTRVRRNNKFKNAIREAGWKTTTEFVKDFNLDKTVVTSWAAGSVSTIFTKLTDPLLVRDLCNIFDCSREDLNNMVRNAYDVRMDKVEQPEESPLGDKDLTFMRIYGIDEDIIPEEGEVPLDEWFAQNYNPEEDDSDEEIIASEFNIEESIVKPAESREYISRNAIAAEILDFVYGKIDRVDYISIYNLLDDWQRKDND